MKLYHWRGFLGCCCAFLLSLEAYASRGELASLTTPVNQGETVVASGWASGDTINVFVDGTLVGSTSQNLSSWSLSFSSSSLSYGSHTVTVYIDYTTSEYVQCWGWDAEDFYVSWWELQDQSQSDLIATQTLIIRQPTTFALNQTSFTYNGSAQGPSVVATPSSATFAVGGTLSAISVGSYTGTAEATDNYTGSNTGLTWTIGKASQTISFNNPGTQTYGTQLTLGATASSGLAVSYSIGSGPATVSGNTVTFTGAGTVTIVASQSGDTNYNAAENVAQSFTVNPWPTTFSLSQTSFTYNGSAQGPSVVPNPSGASYSTSGTLSATTAGTYTAAASGNGNYTGSNTGLTWTIGKASQTISFNNPGTQTNGTPFTLGATASSGLAVSYSVGSGPATVSGNTVTFTGAGTVTIVASQGGDTNYNAAENVAQSFTVNPWPTTFSLSQTSFTYNGSAQGPSVVPSPSGASYSTGGTLSATAGGTYTATATATGNYTGSKSMSWTIAQCGQTISFLNPGTQTYGTPFMLSATASSGLSVSYSVSGPASLSGNTLTFTGTGTVSVTASQSGDQNYSKATDVCQSFYVNPQAATFHLDPASLIYNGSAQSPTVVPSPTGATFTTSGTTSATNTGSYSITVTATGNYSGGATLSWYITVRSQTIAFNNPGTQTYGSSLTLGATATSGLPVSYRVASGLASVSGNVVTFSAIGDVKIIASQPGDSTYGAATEVSQTFTVNPLSTGFSLSSTNFTYNGSAQGPSVVPTLSNATYTSGGVLSATDAGTYTATASATGNYTGSYSLTWTINKAAQTIAFDNPGTQTSGTSLTLNATASSGLAVTYKVSGPATVSGNVVTFSGHGTATVTASQAGNGNYNPATDVGVTFTVQRDPDADDDGDGMNNRFEALLGTDPDSTNSTTSDSSSTFKVHKP